MLLGIIMTTNLKVNKEHTFPGKLLVDLPEIKLHSNEMNVSAFSEHTQLPVDNEVESLEKARCHQLLSLLQNYFYVQVKIRMEIERGSFVTY